MISFIATNDGTQKSLQGAEDCLAVFFHGYWKQHLPPLEISLGTSMGASRGNPVKTSLGVSRGTSFRATCTPSEVSKVHPLNPQVMIKSCVRFCVELCRSKGLQSESRKNGAKIVRSSSTFYFLWEFHVELGVCNIIMDF